MSEASQSDPSKGSNEPGKTRTWWHPLFARMLDFVLASAFEVEEEVSVGKLPLRVDILLIRREVGRVTEAARRELSALLPLLNRFTLIEFKAPTDSVEHGDFAQLVGCSFLWYSQQAEPIPHEDVSLVVLSPVVNGPLRDELLALGLDTSQQEPGIHRVTGLPFAAWLVETDVMAERPASTFAREPRVLEKSRAYNKGVAGCRP